MKLQRAALLTAGPLAALGLSTGLAHADTVDLFSADGVTITSDGLTGTPVEVGGLPPIDVEYEYAGQALDVNSVSDLGANVYTDTDLFSGTDTLVDLTPGQSIADSDIFDTFSLAGGAVVLEHASIADSLGGLLDTGSYDALVVDGTTFALPEAVSNLLGPDFGLTALDVAVLSEPAADAAAALDVTPFIDVLASLF